MAELVTVVLADDEPDVRKLTRMLLERAGRFEIVAEAADGQQATEQTLAHRPDVLVLDLMMPRLSGRDALPEIVRCCPETMIAIVSALPADEHSDELLSFGAFTYYEKGSQLADLPDRLGADHARFQQALQGEDTVAPWATGRR